jgi:uncharacterized protein (UPF0371 family)
MSKLVGINMEVTSSRTLYIEVPDDFTEEQILEKAKVEFKTPPEIFSVMKTVLKQVQVKIPKLDLTDWDINSINYKIINNDIS